MSAKELKALKDKDIQVGDWVWLPYRGGKREGHVQKIAMSTDETPHPPKVTPPRMRPSGESHQAEAPMHVSPSTDTLATASKSSQVIFVDQHNKEVAHNPSTLTVVKKGAEKEKV